MFLRHVLNNFVEVIYVFALAQLHIRANGIISSEGILLAKAYFNKLKWE